MWTQIVGKVRLAMSPRENHWWHVPLYLTARGLTTSPMPHGDEELEIEFDFIDHQLVVESTDGRRATIELGPRSVADFYRTLTSTLHGLGVDVPIRTLPVEVPDPIPFDADERHASYDPAAARRFWRVLSETQRVLKELRSGFLGKTSPVHFFWGSFDLACTRFSGRRAPAHPSVPSVPDFITREAYSHEVWSGGFWPGDARFPAPIFYAYAYPEPPGFKEAPVRPAAAHYEPALAEMVLRYGETEMGPDPDRALAAFFESSYIAAATLGGWDRQALERGAPLSRDSAAVP
jgi:hypothetical protein